MHAWLVARPRWLRWSIAAVSSVLFGLGAPPQGWTAGVWFGFVPILLVLRTEAPLRVGRVAWLGVGAGLGTGLVGFPWMAETLTRFGGFPDAVSYLGLGLFALWTALPFGVWALAVAFGPTRGGWAIAWPVLSWVAIADAWPSLFPYTPMIGLTEAPAWIQIAELVGVAGVEAQVVLVGVLVAEGLLRFDPKVWRSAATLRLATAAGIVALSWGLGRWRMAVIDDLEQQAPSVRFGVVQPNVPLRIVSAADSMLRLRTTSARAQAQGAQIIVWPEAGAYPFRTVRPWYRDSPDPARRVLASHRLPTIFGAASIDRGGRWEYNTVYALAADGRVIGRFDKNILVPFGEYVPWVDPEWALAQVPSMSHNLAGTAPARFEIAPASPVGGSPPAIAVGPLVCYEDIFAGFARQVAAQPGGVHVFVNVTIDTWFGVTAEPWEHLALAQFRSVEHRVPMVRSVAAGVSAVIDATGTVIAYAPARDPEAAAVPPDLVVADVAIARNTETAPTVYARGGWLVVPLAQGFVVLAIALHLRRRRRARASVGPPAPRPEPALDPVPDPSAISEPPEPVP